MGGEKGREEGSTPGKAKLPTTELGGLVRSCTYLGEIIECPVEIGIILERHLNAFDGAWDVLFR